MINDNTPRPHQKYNDYITTIFDTVQNELNAKHNKSTVQGSTVCMVLIYDFKGQVYVTSIWTGDSRAIGCNQNLIASGLTLDHKPDGILESIRIKKLGGEVSFAEGDVPRIDGVLAVSRSLGDFDQKKYVEHKPDINHFIGQFKFIVIATDGLWDVMDNQTVCDFVLQSIINNPKLLTNKLKKAEGNIAFKLAEKAIKLGSDDNITIIIYFIDRAETDYTKYL